MKFIDLENLASVNFPAIALDSIFPKSIRKIMMILLDAIFFVSILLTLLSFGFYKIEYFHTILDLPLTPHEFFKLISGFTMLSAVPWLLLFSIESFRNYYYFREIDLFDKEADHTSADLDITYTASQFIYRLDPDDVTRSFFDFWFGQSVISRLGIQFDDVNSFLSSRVSRVKDSLIELSKVKGSVIGMSEISLGLLNADRELTSYLFKYGIQPNDFVAVSDWISDLENSLKRNRRWWSKENLGKIPGLAKDWSYGEAYTLMRFAHDLTEHTILNQSRITSVSSEIDELEKILSKDREANALMVGVVGGGIEDVISGFVKKIQDGNIFPQLEHKRVFMLDTARLVATGSNKTDFEKLFIKLLREAEKAGNIIIIIRDLPSFISSAYAIGTNVVEILDPYLNSKDIQFIAESDPDRYHSVLEKNSEIMERFDSVLIKETDTNSILTILKNEAIKIESKHNVLFTYGSLVEIAKSASQYFADAVMPDKAIDLLSEVIPKDNKTERVLITKNTVLLMIHNKTGVPTGDISQGEKEKLIHLEELLHERVVGQEEAVSSISSAMRRARSGITNPNRPIGSFLFLGPTGVGKTETTKALASAFFGNENAILRLDMSEYKTNDSLEKLIGSFDDGKPGVLSSMVKEKPYGVLLLDEFEKTTGQVLDLFLQILDEGFFSDMRGKKIYMRNLIIIATSNAGSDLIWQMMSEKGDLKDKKDEIVNSIIKQGIFKPELLNRFDGVILFHPISDDHLRKIANFMLGKLEVRLRERGLELEINDELVSYLMRFGSDPKFGARPMIRAIQDKVEQVIADKIIKGEIVPGTKFTLSEKDFV